ncbi:MAG: ADP-ribosylglycohydrolase family protein [Planctomycetia bacterium]|nr:ADP-ribosylglycohydrolase family protein [Planctomycetia bacterium]
MFRFSLKSTCALCTCLFALLCGSFASFASAQEVVIDGKTYRKISVEEYRDKMKGGWIGQIAGVCWGAPTEFRYLHRMIPEEEMPQWTSEMINDAFGQDDLYVEMTFLHAMEKYGLDVSIRQAGIEFANSEYALWHANVHGRSNLRAGIAPPNSGRPEFSSCSDDIDYQIEADYSGLISPGIMNNAIRMGETFGALMNYGDGLYAGQFIGAMYSEAFFETDVVKIIESALQAIPQECQYAEMVRDVLAWKREFPNDWTACWQKINEKYHENPEYRKHSCSGASSDFNIDVKINGAFVLVGLLYGEGDLDQTIVLATRCGQDSDCNPSSAGGVLFTTLGFKALPPRFSEKLDETRIFSHTQYNFPALLDVCESLATQAVKKEGGFIREEDGVEYYYIPRVKPTPSKLTASANPTDEPLQGEQGNYTPEELKQIKFREYSQKDALEKFFDNFQVSHMGSDMHPGYRAEYRGKKNVFMTHPEDRVVGAILSKEIKASPYKALKFDIAHHRAGDQLGDFELIIKLNGQEVQRETICEETVGSDGWKEIVVDLAPYQGKDLVIELVNQPNGWSWEAAYFADLTWQK